MSESNHFTDISVFSTMGNIRVFNPQLIVIDPCFNLISPSKHERKEKYLRDRASKQKDIAAKTNFLRAVHKVFLSKGAIILEDNPCTPKIMWRTGFSHARLMHRFVRFYKQPTKETK